MNELCQVHDTHGRPKIADNIYCFQLATLTRACCVKSQLHRLKLHVPIDGPSTRPTNLEPHSWRGKLEPQLRDISHWKTKSLARLSVIPKLTNVGV